MAGPVPLARSLSDIYPEAAAVDAQAPRWTSLLAEFERQYGHRAGFVARSPGRVNIIGEHIDYSLYSVLPMAITADAIIAVSAVTSPADAAAFKVRVRNVQNSKFPAGEFDVPIVGSSSGSRHGQGQCQEQGHGRGCGHAHAHGHGPGGGGGGDDEHGHGLGHGLVPIDATKFEWTNYFKSGLRGALELLYKKRGPDFRPCSMDVLMDGTVPVGGGLSSSAALVTASALAVMIANGERPVDKKELTELAIVSERAVGVNAGGMDQAASVFSEQGSATFVSFSPGLEARPVKFPPTSPELCFVIAQSFVTSNKQVTGPIHYNLRVVEVSFAAAYLNAVLNPTGAALPADAGPLGMSLRGFHQTYFQHQRRRQQQQQQQQQGGSEDLAATAGLSTEEELRRLVALTEQTLTKDEGYTREEIAGVLNVTVAELEQRFMSKFPVRAERFKLRQRALHVFTEALRVLEFLKLLEQQQQPQQPHPQSRPVHSDADTDSLPSPSASSSSPPSAHFNAQLGRLMNETQDSCRELYECSCPEIDEICRISRAAGAYSSRLTGAGWGGCSVHLVPADKVAAVREALEREYYSKLDLAEEQKSQAVVVSRPAGGSAVYWVGEGGGVA